MRDTGQAAGRPSPPRPMAVRSLGSPGHERRGAAGRGERVRAFQGGVAWAFVGLVATAGEGQMVVVSAQVVSHRLGGHFLLRDILCALGAAARTPRSLGERLREQIAPVWRALPTPVRSTLAPLRDRAVRDEGVRVGAPGIGIDVDRSRCFPLANGLAVSGIRLNLAGREPRGMLAPGDEEARFVAQLEADLLRSSTM